MKIRLLMAALFGVITVNAFAQKGELNTAQTEFDSYQTIAGQKVLAAKAASNLANAKASIDKASTNAKTSGLPQTMALKAAIYASIAVQDTVSSTSATEFATAQEALKKATELDTKKENAKLIDHAGLQLAQFDLNKGVAAFQSKKFDEAYTAFDAARQIRPDDTTIVLNTSIAAINAKNYPAAIANYKKLTTTNYSGNPRIYSELPTLYLMTKDTAAAIKAIGEGVAKYPNDADLRKREIEVSLQAGQANNLLTKVQAAIQNDPKNKNLYYYEGLTYSQIAEAAGKELTAIKKSTAKTAKTAKPGAKAAAPDPQIAKLEQTKFDNFAKAAEQYKKAVDLDPSYFEANLNLGYVIIAPSIDLYNDTQQLPVSETKQYAANMAKVKTQLETAKPYLLKAVELNPKSSDALTNLKSYYLAKQDNVNANDVQKKLDALPKN